MLEWLAKNTHNYKNRMSSKPIKLYIFCIHLRIPIVQRIGKVVPAEQVNWGNAAMILGKPQKDRYHPT